jgi:hypothetical protein
MGEKTIRSCFESDRQQRRALNAFFDAWGGWWPVSNNLDMYEASQSAFDPSLSDDEALRYFMKIYDELGCWQVFRSRQKDAYSWEPLQIFKTIKREFREFSWSGRVNLQNVLKSGTGYRLESCLRKMEGIKQKQGYPHMAVSKFLHFYNPALFPIYDCGFRGM